MEDERRGPQQRCDACHRLAQSYGFFRVSSGPMDASRDLCNRCFNEWAARRMGLDRVYQHVDFEPIVLPGASGERHELHFRTHLYGDGVLLEGSELCQGVPCGYAFAVSAEPDGDPMVLFQRLLAKARLGLSRTHLVEGELGPTLGSECTVRGRFEWDEETQGGLPLLIVDGKPIPWEVLGRILSGYEGFQFKLEVRERSDDV